MATALSVSVIDPSTGLSYQSNHSTRFFQVCLCEFHWIFCEDLKWSQTFGEIMTNLPSAKCAMTSPAEGTGSLLNHLCSHHHHPSSSYPSSLSSYPSSLTSHSLSLSHSYPISGSFLTAICHFQSQCGDRFGKIQAQFQ